MLKIEFWVFFLLAVLVAITTIYFCIYQPLFVIIDAIKGEDIATKTLVLNILKIPATGFWIIISQFFGWTAVEVYDRIKFLNKHKG